MDNFLYENTEIPQILIDGCEAQAIKNKEVMFIFDGKISERGALNELNNKSLESRDERLALLTGEYDEEIEAYKDTYHIGDETYFKMLPSRFSYYDTETKEVNRYEKYKKVIDFINRFDFEASQSNFGPEYEQSFFGQIVTEPFIMRVKPNLFITVIESRTNKTIYNEFFKIDKIIDAISGSLNMDRRVVMREINLKKIL